MLHTSEPRSERIFVRLDEEAYPEVKVMAEGTTLTVEGKISYLDYNALFLEQARIIGVEPNQ